MNHPSAKKQTAIVFYVWSFCTCLGLQCCFCSADWFWWSQRFPRDPFEFLSLLYWLRNTPASPTQKEASALYCKRLFSHRWPGVGRIIRKCHPFCELRVLSGRDCREDAFQGVWGQPTWLHRWMTVRPWAMCLLGAFCSGRDASSMIAVDGTSDAY